MRDNKEINPRTFHEGYMKRLRAAERELERVEKRVKTLATKQEDIRTRRIALEQQIAEHDEAVAPLLEEREQLRERYTVAAFEGKAGEQEDIHKRREEIDEQVENHEQELSTLRISLDALEDTSREAAELRVRLEQLNYGDAYGFATELRNILVRHESALKSRKSDAERALPKADYGMLEAVRDELVDGYLEKKQRQADEVERAKQDRARKEQELKDKASTPYVGWSGYVDEHGEKLPRGAVDADGTVKKAYQNKAGTRRAHPKNRTVEVVS